MSDILQRLRQDHANVQRLLLMLEAQIAVLGRGESPDWDIVEGVIQYLLTYPDLRHHPLEDQILEHLQVKELSVAEPFLGLFAEHREQAQELRRIAAGTRQVRQDVGMAQRDYFDLLSSFVTAQREHIRKEEAIFFPSADRILDAGDWAELESDLVDLIDPLFGDRVERRFAALREKLDHWDITGRTQSNSG
jgi:hemerythrin-like domain-containing protein